MTLPLMPGSEPVEIKYQAPEPPRTMVDEVTTRTFLPGCGCDACRRAERIQAERMTAQQVMAAQVIAAQYGGTVTGRAQRAFNWDATTEVSGPFDWRQTPPAPQIPELTGPNQGRLRGQYDPQVGSGNCFVGQYRWLDPVAGQLYAVDGSRSNRVDYRNGQWQSTGGLVWRPT